MEIWALQKAKIIWKLEFSTDSLVFATQNVFCEILFERRVKFPLLPFVRAVYTELITSTQPISHKNFKSNKLE